MAKKKVTRKKTSAPRKSARSKTKADPLDEAKLRLQQAREELRQATEAFEQLQNESEPAEQLDESESFAMNLLEDTVQFVRKYPALGVSAAAAVGFFVGRLFRR